MYISQSDPSRSQLRRSAVLAVVASLTCALAVATARPAHASPLPVPGPTGALAGKLAAKPTPAGPTREVPQAPSAATVLPNKAAAPVSIYPVSKAVYTFLHSGLGLALGGSTKLSGTKSGKAITLTAGKPTTVGLPSGVAAPAFGPTKIVINTKTNVLTAKSSAATSAPASLSVQIAHANTSTLPAHDLTASLSITTTVLGKQVTLSGPLTSSGGRPVLALGGSLPSADLVKSGVITIAKGAAVTLSTSGGLQLKGAATVGAGAAAAPVTVSGTVTNPSSWTLQVAAPATGTSWQPVPGVTAMPIFAGSVAAAAGRITFDLTSKGALTWTPVAGATLSATELEYANTAPPSGAPSLAAGDAWLELTGGISVAGGPARTISTNATIIVNTASGHATLAATQRGTVQLATTPSVSLHDATIAANFTAGSTSSGAPITGTGAITVGNAAPVTATLALTTTGVLVADFRIDLAPFGLGSAGSIGEILYASAPIAAYTVASTGKTISLATGFSSSTGRPANSASSYTLSANADEFLNSLGLDLGAGVISGTPTGSTLTVTAGPPSLPISLPTGDPSVTFGKSTVVVDTATDTVTATATTTADSGTAASITITIRHASAATLTSADLTATVHIAALSLFGTTVDLDGSIGYANGKAEVTVSGTITRDLVVAAGVLTVRAGSVVSLSTKDGLRVNGSVDLGAAPANVTVGFDGAITDLRNWSLTVSVANGAPAIQPIDGLTITPKFTGTITDKAGVIGFDISGDDLVSWQPGSSVTVAVKHVEISNESPPTSLACPSAIKDGQLWIDAAGSLTYAPSSSDVNVTASAEACIAPTAKTFSLTTSVVGTLFQGAGFQLGDAVLTITGDLAAGKISVKAAAQIVITTSGNATPLSVGISFGSDGSFVAGVAVSDLGSIGLSGTSGYLFVATKDITNFDPADLGIHNADGSAITPFNLTAGVTATLAFKLSDTYVKALQDLNIPLNGATVQLVATLSKSGFSIKIEVNFGAADQGVTLITTPQGIKIVLDTIYIDFDLSETSTTLSLGATAYLHIPPVVPGGDPSNVEVGVTGSINIDTLTFSVGVSLSGVCGAGGCAWHNAFGIPGLSVDSLSGTIGVDFETAIPTPTISLKVHNLVLPDAWAAAIGMVPGTTITLALDLNLSQPAVDIEIDPGAGSTVALTPLKIFTSDDNVVNQLQIGRADLLFAPLGGTEADGTVLSPGANLVFDATIAGVEVHIAASVDLSPTNPSIRADVAVGGFSIGPVTLQSPMLHLAIAPLAADVSFSGGLSDTTTGIKFAASVDLGVSTALLNAAVSLEIKAGLPQYLAVDGSLSGSVHLDSGGLDVSASGSLYLSVAGFYLSAISVSYSGNASTIWRDLNNDFAAVAAAFVSAYNWSVSQINDALSSLGFNLTQIAQAIASAFNQGATWVLEQLHTAGVVIDAAVQAVIDGIQATDKQVADALQALGWDFNNIATELRDKFNEGSAALYNVLVSIGDYGQSVLNALSSLFNNGSYNLWVADAPDVLDVNGASQSAGAGLIQYTWNGGTNQDWFVLPTDSGYAELVNRNSGQCLDNGGSTGPSDLVQEPCTGALSQQWYLNVYAGDGNLNGQQHVLTNRYSGLVADVTGASFWPGATVEQYYANGGNNQKWTLLPAA